jgi:hypothetical protein
LAFQSFFSKTTLSFYFLSDAQRVIDRIKTRGLNTREKMVEEPTDDRENAEADEDGASAPVPEKVRFVRAYFKVLLRFSLSDYSLSQMAAMFR